LPPKQTRKRRKTFVGVVTDWSDKWWCDLLQIIANSYWYYESPCNQISHGGQTAQKKEPKSHCGIELCVCVHIFSECIELFLILFKNHPLFIVNVFYW